MAALLGASESQAAEACSAAPGRAGLPTSTHLARSSLPARPKGWRPRRSAPAAVGVRRVRPLGVNGAFHTPLMAAAAEELEGLLAATTFSTPTTPVVTNHDAAPMRKSSGWPDRLTTHLVSPVRWADCVTTMVELGVDRFVEVGPGSALTGLIEADRTSCVHRERRRAGRRQGSRRARGIVPVTAAVRLHEGDDVHLHARMVVAPRRRRLPARGARDRDHRRRDPRRGPGDRRDRGIRPTGSTWSARSPASSWACSPRPASGCGPVSPSPGSTTWT